MAETFIATMQKQSRAAIPKNLVELFNLKPGDKVRLTLIEKIKVKA